MWYYEVNESCGITKSMNHVVLRSQWIMWYYKSEWFMWYYKLNYSCGITKWMIHVVLQKMIHVVLQNEWFMWYYKMNDSCGITKWMIHVVLQSEWFMWYYKVNDSCGIRKWMNCKIKILPNPAAITQDKNPGRKYLFHEYFN